MHVHNTFREFGVWLHRWFKGRAQSGGFRWRESFRFGEHATSLCTKNVSTSAGVPLHFVKRSVISKTLCLPAALSLSTSEKLFRVTELSPLLYSLLTLSIGGTLAFGLGFSEFLLVSRTSSLTLSISGIVKVRCVFHTVKMFTTFTKTKTPAFPRIEPELVRVNERRLRLRRVFQLDAVI